MEALYFSIEFVFITFLLLGLEWILWSAKQKVGMETAGIVYDRLLCFLYRHIQKASEKVSLELLDGILYSIILLHGKLLTYNTFFRQNLK